MGYARGGSLEDRLVRAYPPQKALRIFRSLASALEYAHKNDLIHGNLSPANILFDESDNLILTDFGQAENHKLGRRGCYAAPEKKKTKLSDIYSAGAILHRLLTNQVPIFDSYLRLIWQESYPKLPISLKMLMSDMLRNGPGDRPKNFAAVLARLEECERDLEKLGKADTGDLPEISRKPLYRPKVVLALLIIVLMGVLVLFHSETLYDLFLRLTSR
jgi:serine/threonine-protein kinase